METVKLSCLLLGEFKAFCIANRKKVDGSYLSDEDLSGFSVDETNPTSLIIGSEGSIAGAASLMATDKAIAASKARFRILWYPDGGEDGYRLLLGALFRDIAGIDSAYLFAPLEDRHLNGVLDNLGFIVERKVYSLMRATALPLGEDVLPEGFTIRPFVKGKDEAAWRRVRNAAFKTVKGNDAPQSVGDVSRMASSPDSIEGAMLVLEECGRAVAVARGLLDELDGKPTMNIGPIAVLPERQGMGFGRTLLRSLVKIASDKRFDVATLSVNADNENALKLYLSEGFTKLRSFACRSVRPSSLL